MLVQQILKSKSDDGVVTIAPGTRLEEAATMLAQRKIGAVVVSPDGKRVAGILSERDTVPRIVVHGRRLHWRCRSMLRDDARTFVTCWVATTARTRGAGSDGRSRSVIFRLVRGGRNGRH